MALTDFSLRGKNCFISGAAGLLTAELAGALAEAGANLFLGDVKTEGLEKLAGELRKRFSESRIEHAHLDVTKAESNQAAVKSCVERLGGIDVLLHGAAVDPKFEPSTSKEAFTGFAQFPLKLWEDSINVNLTGAFLLTQAAAPVIEKAGEGSIIFMGSQYGLVGPDQRIYAREGEAPSFFKPAAYSVGKAGLLGLTKYLAAYYAGTKIRVNMLTPAGVFNGNADEFVKNYSERTTLRRMSRKNEFNGAAVFLASSASSYMTGSNLVVDGGWTAL